MKIVLGSDGSIELTRGEHITRGQDKSRQVFVEWAEGVSPIDTGQFLVDNMVVEMCITRPDGEQSGWLTAVKVDGEIKYLYILQAWDTAVSGQASLQVRWYDITQEESSRIIEASNEAFFIVDNGKIAQPLNLSSENYNEFLSIITPLQSQALRRYDCKNLPEGVTFNADGKKTSPAIFYNCEFKVGENAYKGVLLTSNIEGKQFEVLINEDGRALSRVVDIGTENAEKFNFIAGAKIASTELVGEDENGGYVYKIKFDNGSVAEFTAPKGEKGEKGESIAVGTELSLESENPVQNKVITEALNTLSSVISDVESIAKGSNQAISFNNYEELVNYLNELAPNALKVGQNIYIATRNVPDVWVQKDWGVQLNNPYTYTTDDEIVELLNKGNLVVGHYQIQPLETQKVELTNYPTKNEVLELIPVTDTELSLESENPVQNKVITEALNEKVGFEDYATKEKAGVIRLSGGGGIIIDANGFAYLATASKSVINIRTNGSAVIVPNNLDYAVKKALADCKLSTYDAENDWTDAEKESARDLLGVTDELDKKLDKDIQGEASKNNISTVYAKDTGGNVYNHLVARGSAQISPYRIPVYFGLSESVSVNPNGALATGYPTHNYHATNKEYVDRFAKWTSVSVAYDDNYEDPNGPWYEWIDTYIANASKYQLLTIKGIGLSTSDGLGVCVPIPLQAQGSIFVDAVGLVFDISWEGTSLRVLSNEEDSGRIRDVEIYVL